MTEWAWLFETFWRDDEGSLIFWHRSGKPAGGSGYYKRRTERPYLGFFLVVALIVSFSLKVNSPSYFYFHLTLLNYFSFCRFTLSLEEKKRLNHELAIS